MGKSSKNKTFLGQYRIYNENHDKIYFNLGWDGIKYIIRSSTQR